MLNEGTSIHARRLCGVSVGLMEGMHESPIQSPYALKTLLFVTGVIVQSLFACQNTYYTCWNGDMKAFFFSGNAQRALACATVTLKSWARFERFTAALQLHLRIFARYRKIWAPFRSVALSLRLLHLQLKLPEFWGSVEVPQNTWRCETSWYFCFLFVSFNYPLNLLPMRHK